MCILKRWSHILLLFVLAYACSEAPVPEPTVSVTPRFQALQLNDPDGDPFNHGAYAGKAVVVNVWATWCKPCRAEMPSFAKAISTINDTSIAFLFVSPEEMDEIRSFINDNDYPFSYAQLVNAAEMRVMALPTTMIFDRSGKMVFSEMGYRQWDTPESLALIRKNCQ